MPHVAALYLAAIAIGQATPDSTVVVDANRVVNHITPFMYGSCIEDVNHEIYGGLYAQLLFGESFEEPPASPPVPGWTAFGGIWKSSPGVLSVGADFGAKAVHQSATIGDGVVSCEVRFLDEKGGNGGLILRVRDPKTGADNWIGYEVSLSSRDKHVMVGRHRNDYHLLKQVPLPVESGRWHRLRAELDGPTIRVRVDDAEPSIIVTDTDRPLLQGSVGVRTWGSDVEFRKLVVESSKGASPIPIEPDPKSSNEGGVSACWDLVKAVDATAKLTWDPDRPYNTSRSQRIEKTGGSGAVGIANRGLNRWGIAIREGKEYAGRVYVRQEGFAGRVTVALQSGDGSKTYASQILEGIQDEWRRQDFTLRSNASDDNARFLISVDAPGKVWVDQAYLSATGDALVKEEPFRSDLTEPFKNQGIKLLRYGGTMVNVPGYRWKSMIGDRDRRPQYRGNWYPYSTNGFGIEEFVRYCRLAGFEPVVAINIEESPQDIADLVEYLNGPSTTEWGRKRGENGHPEPYKLRYLEIGNEETTNAHYIERFHLLSDALRPKDADIQLIIAAWWEPENPISRRIVRELSGKAALWDVHVGGDDPREGRRVDALFDRMERLYQEWMPGTYMKACVLEENGGHHDLARALGHASVLNATQRHGDFVLIDCPANTLQAYLQNDNGWDQGQLFYKPGQIWAMPNYYSQKMAAEAHLPCRLASVCQSPNDDLDFLATRDEAGTSLVLKVVNVGSKPHTAVIDFEGFGSIASPVEISTLAGALQDRNLPDNPDRIRPKSSNEVTEGTRVVHEFPQTSFSVLKIKKR